MAIEDDDPLRKAHRRALTRSELLTRRLLARWGVMPMPPGTDPEPLPNDGNGPVDKPGPAR